MKPKIELGQRLFHRLMGEMHHTVEESFYGRFSNPNLETPSTLAIMSATVSGAASAVAVLQILHDAGVIELVPEVEDKKEPDPA